MIAQKSFFHARGLAVPTTDFAPDAPPTKQEVDPEYEAWKRDMGLDVPLSAEQVNDIITCELVVL